MADTGTGLFPSVTTIAKQALPLSQNVINWLNDLAVSVSLDVCVEHLRPGVVERGFDQRSTWNPPPREQLEAMIADEFRARRTSQADRGTLIHAEVETYYQGGEVDLPDDPAALKAVEQITRQLVRMATPQCETPFASVLGWAGKCDLLIPNDDIPTWTLADLKCPNTKSWMRFKDELAKGRGPYDEYGIQLAAYRAGLGQPHPDMKCERRVITRCVSILVDGGEDSETAGECLFYEWPHDTLLRFGRVFSRAFENWCEMRDYDPRPKEAKGENQP